MELRDAIRTYVKRRWLGIGIVVVVVAGAYIWTYLQPVNYSTSMSFGVTRANKQKTTAYEYDGYYALQAADLFSQTLVSWLQTPSVLVDIYQTAGLDTGSESVRNITSRFKTKKYSAQNVVVTFGSPTREEASRLAESMTNVTRRMTESENRTSEDQALFSLEVTKPVITQTEPNPWLVGGVALVVGLTLALFIVPFVSYLALATVER